MSWVRVLLIGSGFWFTLADQAWSQPPSCLVPGGRMIATERHGIAAPRPAAAYPIHPPSYNYGWFGAAPRQHWSRHSGFYRNYIEWSAR